MVEYRVRPRFLRNVEGIPGILAFTIYTPDGSRFSTIMVSITMETDQLRYVRSPMDILSAVVEHNRSKRHSHIP